MMVNFKAGLLVCTLSVISTLSVAAETSKPFPHGALSDHQQSAWQSYLRGESAVFGCEYGDDIRLIDDPEGTLRALVEETVTDPVQVTLRSFTSMGPNTRNIVAKRVKIASIECNPVYFDGNDMIGLPVIPFEEALTLLHDDYFAQQDDERIRALIRSFKVATIDPRWFWAFFIADKDHLDMLGYDYETVRNLERILMGYDSIDTDDSNAYAMLYHILKNINYNRPTFYSLTGECEKDNTEPSRDVVIWKSIPEVNVTEFYRTIGQPYTGKWKTTTEKVDGGLKLVSEQPVENSSNPYFNVTRGMTVHSQECN